MHHRAHLDFLLNYWTHVALLLTKPLFSIRHYFEIEFHPRPESCFVSFKIFGVQTCLTVA